MALATITELEKPWKQDVNDGFWEIAEVTITESDKKGIPLRTVLKILTGEDISSGIKRGVTLKNLYAGRVTEISPGKYASFLQYFSIEEPDSVYQDKVANVAPTKPPTDPQDPEWGKLNGRTILLTKPGIGQFCLKNSNYKCEVNNEHHTFISKASGRNYVEAHHLIPLKSQASYKKTLDNHANIVSLCPNCHQLLHHASDSEKRTPLKALLNNKRKHALKNRGTPITFNELFKYY